MQEREYIRVDDYYYELHDIIIKKEEQFENVYYWKSFDNLDNFEVVYKELDVFDLKIYKESEVPEAEKPQYYDYVEPKWYSKLIEKIKFILSKIFK